MRSVNHALAIRPETQKDSEVHRVEQELSCHSDSAAQWRVCRVHTVGGEHRTGMFGGSSPETGVKRGMCAVSSNTSTDCPSDRLLFLRTSQQEGILVKNVLCSHS